MVEGLSAAPLPEVMDAIGSLADSAGSAPGRKTAAFHVSSTIIFSIVAGRPDRDLLLETLSPVLGHWKEPLIRKLERSSSASYCKRAMMDFVARCSTREELEPLLSARNGMVASWAAEARGDGIIAKAAAPAQDSDGLRFIDSIFLDEGSLALIRRTAEGLGLSPSELETMVFYFYSGFSLEHAIDITKNENAEYIIQDVSMHLAGGDGPGILLSSYLIFSLRCRDLGAEERSDMVALLWDTVGRMHSEASYAGRFFNEAYRLRGERIGGAVD